MLDRNAMAQLKGLRDELEAQNERVDATIKGTQHRYGFAVTDDGREVFIPPDEMLKVYPATRSQSVFVPQPTRRASRISGANSR